MIVIKYKNFLYEMECQIFRTINQLFPRKYLNRFFRIITYLGGATFTILTCLMLIIFGEGTIRHTALASAFSLTISHIPVALVKKMFPRKRPYLVLDEIYVTDKPLKDHSFPSGHTTAIFAVIIPFILFIPSNSVALLLVLIGTLVGISRIVLGLHYPSDVFVGFLLGTCSGYFSFFYVMNYNWFYFI